MSKEDAEQIVIQYMKRIYAFVMKRVANEQDIQDVTQDICLNLYQSLCQKEIYDIQAYVWTVVRHSLANYYRGKQKSYYNISLEEGGMDLEDGSLSALDQIIERESRDRIQREIAYLSKIQRAVIILYYYEGKKQTEIAESLQIPLGTVKWHLNAAKSELKKGMKKMRSRNELKFNPIAFSVVGMSGGRGEMGAAANFFRSALSRNIVYSICREALTVEEIADAIGVSPVYVESELEFLETYSLVLRKKDRYVANIIIEEPVQELICRHRSLYQQVAGEIANTLYDRICEEGYLQSEEICGPDEDKNFIMWSLVFYLLAWAKSDHFKEKITFDEVAELRADGGKNIITATVKNEVGEKYLKDTGMSQFSGPCWNGDEDILLWVMDGDWTERRITYGDRHFVRNIQLLKRFVKREKLFRDDYAFLLQNHYVRRTKDGFELALCVLRDGSVRQELLKLTSGIKNEVLGKIQDSLQEYRKLLLESDTLPEQMRKTQEYLLQHMFYSDGWFMLYAKEALVQSGRLKPVEGDKKYSVTELLVLNK